MVVILFLPKKSWVRFRSGDKFSISWQRQTPGEEGWGNGTLRRARPTNHTSGTYTNPIRAKFQELQARQGLQVADAFDLVVGQEEPPQ
jgi:hypothetical protein